MCFVIWPFEYHIIRWFAESRKRVANFGHRVTLTESQERERERDEEAEEEKNKSSSYKLSANKWDRKKPRTIASNDIEDKLVCCCGFWCLRCASQFTIDRCWTQRSDLIVVSESEIEFEMIATSSSIDVFLHSDGIAAYDFYWYRMQTVSLSESNCNDAIDWCGGKNGRSLPAIMYRFVAVIEMRGTQRSDLKVFSRTDQTSNCTMQMLCAFEQIVEITTHEREIEGNHNLLDFDRYAGAASAPPSRAN